MREPNEINEHLATNDTSQGGACLTPADADELEIAMAEHREELAYALVRKAEAHLAACNEHWERACTEVRQLKAKP